MSILCDHVIITLASLASINSILPESLPQKHCGSSVGACLENKTNFLLCANKVIRFFSLLK